MTRRTCCIVLYFVYFSLSSLFAQESIGLINDNYTPSIGMRLNPSIIADQKPWLSIHLAGLNTYLRNNLAFIESSKLQFINQESNPAFNTQRRAYSAYTDIEVYGPSISFTHRKHAFGIHSAVRAYSFIRNIPNELGDYIDEQESFEIEEGNYRINNLESKGMAWAEAGISYAHLFKQNKDEIWTWGISVNKLFGIASAGIEVSEANIDVRDSLDFGIIGNANANYFYNEPSFNSGKGWGISTGITFKKMKSDAGNHTPHSPKGACKIPDYKYKIGLSIIDFGNINYSVNAESGNLTADFTTDDLEDIIDQGLTDQLVIDSQSEFKTALPLALGFQYDFNLKNRVFLNATLIQNLEFLSTSAIKRANTLSASLRYESRWVGFSLPISLYNYSTPQIGLALRFGTFVIGSDHITPFLIESDIYAADLYFAVQIPILRNPSCAKKDKNKRNTKKTTDTYPPCPKW